MGSIEEISLENGTKSFEAYLAELEPCIFPQLNDGVEVQKELRSVKISLQHEASLVNRFCQKNGVKLSELMRIIWGLVLRSYTSMDLVRFMYSAVERNDNQFERPANGTSKGASNRTANGTTNGTAKNGKTINIHKGLTSTASICNIHFDGTSSIRAVIETIESKSLPGRQYYGIHTEDRIRQALTILQEPLLNTGMRMYNVGEEIAEYRGKESEVNINRRALH